MINKEYAKKVYNGLVKRGYTSEDLGNEAKFVERMGKETNRRYLYDLVNKRGDANLGTFEGFEKRMGVTSKPEAGGIVGPMPFDAGIPSIPQTQSAQQPISNFGEGVAQGADALYQGGKNAVAEYSNIITGSQRDAQLGLDILSARSEGVIPEFDVNSELDAYNKSEYEKRLKDIEDRRAAATSTTAGRWKQFATDLFFGREEDNLRKENLSVADYLHRKRAFEAIEQALKDSAGDVEKAKKLLAERAKIESWGDAKGREAREAMSQHRPTEGAAWVGEMIPQMAGTAAGLAASLHPATRSLAGVLGKSNLLGLTISSMGSQMAEARSDGASEGDVFKAGALNAAVEAGSEYVPFSRYFGRLVKNTGDVIGRVVGESLEHSPRAKKELQDLLKKGSKELGKLFTGNNAMEFAKDITEEAASEFVAEFGNALIPIIYSNQEDYPTLLQAVENGWEGAKGGLFMGTFLGIGSKLASYYAHDKRRKQQGFVVLAETSDGDVVEYAGKDENGNAVVIDGNGEQRTIDSDELGEAVRVSYNEFKTGERRVFRDKMEESFNDGKSAQTKEDKEYIGLSYEYALRRLEELSGLSAEDIKNGFPNAVAVYEAADDAVKANNIEYAKALNDYANAWARLEGSNNAIEEVVEQQSAASDAEVDALSDNGVMRPATLRSGEEVFVVGGNIAVDNNGGIVYEESDAQIVVNVNGERKVVGIAEIGAVGETVNSEEEKISRRGRIESDINNKHNSDINGWKELIPGESYNVLFDGTPFELMVVGRNENGELLISGDGGKSTEPISEADFQNSIREYELRQITVAELNERFAGKLKVLNAMLANIRTESNEDKAAANYSEVENMVAELDGELPDGYRVVAENGNYVIADALVSANENEASAEGEKGSEGEKVAEGNGQQPNVVQEPVLSPAEQRKQKRAEVAKRIPTEGKKRLWTKAKPEDVAEYISLLESDPAKQAAMVDGYLAEIAEKQAKLSPIEAAELNEDVEFWNGVKGLLKPAEGVSRMENTTEETPAAEEVKPANEMQPVEVEAGEPVGNSEQLPNEETASETAEEGDNGDRTEKVAPGKQKKSAKRAERKKRYAAEDAKLGDYLDFMDYVMREIATGGVKFIWGNSKNSKTKGLGAHLGLTQSSKERMRRIWMLDNEGSYPELAASRLLNEYSAMFGMGMPEEVIGMTDMDAFDILLDVLATYDSPKAMFEAVQERHNMAEDPYYDITEEEAEAMSMNMSLDEWTAYQEYMMEYAEFMYNNISDEELYAIFAENNLIEDNERSRENNAVQQGISERQGYEAGNAEGNPVLQGEQLDNTRTDREGATTGQERNAVLDEQGSVNVSETSVLENAEVGKDTQTEGETSNGSTISQESEQVGEQVAGPVNMETLQLNMSEEDFNALLNSGDKAAISEYLAEMDNALRIDESSPFAGQMALREEYKSAVQQYGKENIPAEVMADLEKRMKPYSDLGRAIYDRKYALQDKLREIETSAEKATAAKEKEIKVENKNTAFGGFLADKTDLGASTAEKALNKKYNFDGKVMTVAEFVENAVANGDAKLSTIEEPKYKGASRAAWNRMDAKQQEEDAKKVKESGTKTVYTVNDHDLGKTAYDYAKFLLEQKAEQEKVAEKEKESERVERIEDVGEKIGGAKKDKLRETIDRMKADMEQSDETLIDKIAKLPISKIFNFDFQKLREGGMPNEAISFMEIVKESIPAKPRTSHKVRRWVNNTLALYKLCLEVGTNWDRVNTILTSRDFAGTDLKAQFDAYMSVGGFDSGLNIGNAKLKQLDKTAGYYKDGKFVSSEGKWYVRDAGKHGGIYDTKEEAVEALKAFAGDNAGTTESGKKKEVKFAVYQRREDKSIFIAIKGKSDIVIQDGFKSAKEAFDYIEANNAELQSRYRNLLDKTNADFEENRERKGRDYRNGKDITAEEFRTTFGFRGVEFGNWMTQEDRRKAINECYDALMDLAAVCKVSPKALSLNGTLGMAFGSRGGGKFSAHYEPGKVVINLTKTRGAGTLAHEWFHAIDNYFAKMGETEFGYATGGEGMLPKGIQKYGKRYYDRNSGRVITEEEYNELAKEHAVRREMVDAWEHLMESLKNSDYYKRSNAYARLHNSKYWNDPTELGARAFSVWVENELSKQDTSNDYLANNPRYAKAEVTDAQDKYMPYPFDTDADWMDEAFGNLFEVMQERETEDDNVALYQRGSLSLETDNPAFEGATKATMQALEKTGIEVVMATPGMVEAVNEFAEMQKKSLETALPEDESSFKGTVVSSDDGTKVLKDIDNAIAKYENKGNSTKTFIGDIARILRAVRHGSKSEYADFVTINGNVVRIRLADHNVKVSNYDNAGINNGISIVISRKPNEGITNDGNAHLVEYFYPDKKINSADGKPLVEILKSIKQALYSGEYRDNTGLAQREEVNIPDFLRTGDGTVYGWAVNGKIYLAPEGMNPNTPAHEYTHLWAAMVEKNDPKLWSRIVEVMKESPTWNEVLLDEAYRDIHNNDSRMASEVLSRLSGEENYRRAMELAEREIKAADGIIEKAKKIALWGRIKQALADFWNKVKELFDLPVNGEPVSDVPAWMEFVNMSLGDLYAGVNPNAVGSPLEKAIYGGNSGYVGYSMSKRAEEARKEGRFPKTDFKKNYGLSEKVFAALVDAGIVSGNEWHHTSVFGNRTTFYSWENKGAADFFEQNKERVAEAVKNGTLNELKNEFERAAEDYQDKEIERYRQEAETAEREKRLRDEYDAYLKETLLPKDGTFVASNGVVVRHNGALGSSSWIAEMDGERLSKRNGKEKRDAAFAEFKEFVDKAPRLSFEEWKEQENGTKFAERETENIGEFSKESNDIRFRQNEEEHSGESERMSQQEKNTNFASKYVTEDGKAINYTSESNSSYSVSDNENRDSDNGTGGNGVQWQNSAILSTGHDNRLNAETGEFCVVERVFTESGSFNFTSGERIENADDVAFIFSALEDAAKEHSFVVYVKDGQPTVVELGMGTFNATMVDIPTASLAYNRVNPDEVYFVHNHPSGNLKCSPEDIGMLKMFEDMCDVPVYGVIINLKSGNYGTFGTNNDSSIGSKRIPETQRKLTIHTLDKQIFTPGYNPMEQPLVRSSKDVASFLNSQRMGDRAKVSFLIISRAGRIVGNIHTPFTEISSDPKGVARYIGERIVQFGGESAILYGDFSISYSEQSDYMKLKDLLNKVSRSNLLDIVRVEGNHTKSAVDFGLIYEPKSEYNADEKVDKSESVVRDMDLSDGPVREPGEPEWKFKARREKWRRWVNSFVSTKDPVPEKPFQGADETDEEYRERLKAFNKGLKEWKKQVTKTDAGIDEMMEALYNGKSPEQTTEEEFTENVFRRYMGRDGGIEISKKGMRGIIRDEIIERRRLIETNNFEDVLFVNKVKDATTPEERKIIPFIIEGTYNGEVSPELAAVVKSVKDWFETVYQMLQAADAMHSSGKIKNYVTHIWDKERTPKKVYENYINTRSKYTNKRSIETYAEGIALGMVPKYDDVCDIMLEYGHIANEAVANKKFIDFLHELTVDGEPVLIDAKKSNPLYKKTTSEALEGYRVHKYVSGIVNTVLGSVRTPDVPEWASGIAHFYDIAGAFMKKVNLSLSFFHHGALIETAVGAQGPIKAGKTLFKNIIWDSIRTGKAPALANPEASRRAVNHLVQLGATSDYLAKDVQRLTGRLKKFAEELRDKNPNMLTDGAENVATFIDFLNYGFDEVLWTYLHDGLKIYAFDKYAKEIDEYCAKKGLDETDKDMLLNEAGQFVNDTFGGQFWELLDISPVMQKWLRRGLLSPDWTLSTIRQALSPFGFGSIYKDYEDKWYQRLLGGRGDKTDSSAFGRLMNMTEGVKLRRRLGVSFWTMAALTFIPAMNLLNAWRRADDEEDELEKAKEKRKTDPNYKSPYELKYPNGMKWYDYTMVGNTLGHKTHLFGGRYDDGKEMYIRWGKQFRELPELFLGKDGFVFPGPMIDKLVEKVNPAAHAVLDFAGFSKDGWENVYMKDKIGWEKELGRVMSLVVRCMPYSIPFDEDKEFALTDLMMPSSKGYSRYKALRHFEEAIKSQDLDFVGEVYNACVINKLDAEKLLKAALSRVEAEAKSEYVEGVETLNDAFEAYPVSDVERKRSIRKKMLRLLEENRYKDFERADAEELILKALRGDGDKASVSLPDVYLRMETPEDVVDDYKIKAIKMALAKVYKEWKGIEDIGARAEYERKHTKQLGLRDKLNEVDRKIAEQKRAMSENTKYADAYMNIIRETRREFIERADNLGETVSQME